MVVYRVCNEEEINKIFDSYSFCNVGSCFNFSNLNNHRYDNDKKYLHFFLNKDSILYLRTLKDRYLCIYDIPEYILEKYQGIGYYLDYINYLNLNEVVEYAVLNKFIEFDFLKQIFYITRDFDIDDFLDDCNLTGFIDSVYDVSNKKLLLKKY